MKRETAIYVQTVLLKERNNISDKLSEYVEDFVESDTDISISLTELESSIKNLKNELSKLDDAMCVIKEHIK